MIAAAFQATPKQLRQFAWAAPVGFALVGWMLRKLGLAEWWPFAGLGLGVVVLLVGLAQPLALRPLYAFAMLIAAPIGWIVSNVAVAILYYLMIVPLGLFFRLIGRDALDLRRKTRGSAWSEREAETDAASYYRQG